MIPHNCVRDTLDRLHETGGYAVMRASTHWRSLHMMHMSQDGVLSSYVPERDLDKPISALFGFEGSVRDYDAAIAGPVPVRSLLVSSWVLAVGVTAWAVARWWRGLFERGS